MHLQGKSKALRAYGWYNNDIRINLYSSIPDLESRKWKADQKRNGEDEINGKVSTHTPVFLRTHCEVTEAMPTVLRSLPRIPISFTVFT